MIQQLISQKGPLPIRATFNYQGDGSVGFYVGGSAWTKSVQSIGAQLLLDGNSLGFVWVYANEANSHKALMPKLLSVKMTLGQHEVALVAWEGTVTDSNDYFVVQIID